MYRQGNYQYNDDGTVSQLTSSDSTINQVNAIVPFDKQAQLKTQIENNTTALGISATYTGATFDTMADGTNFSIITVSAASDQTGTLLLQQSADGTNWFTTDSVAITANPSLSAKIVADVVLRYVRLVVTNGATAQTKLYLYGYAAFRG
jgi:hypothetical protein